MIDCATFQVGLTVMNFIVGEQRRRLCRLADHDTGLPDLLAVVHHLEMEVRMLSATCVVPRLRGIQRQRSSVATTASIWLWRLGVDHARKACSERRTQAVTRIVNERTSTTLRCRRRCRRKKVYGMLLVPMEGQRRGIGRAFCRGSIQQVA